jgi:hypothetical protein
MSLAVVEQLDVLNNCEPGALAGGEPVAVIHLVLQRGKPALRDRIIEARPCSSNTATDPDLLAISVELLGRVLGSADRSGTPGKSSPTVSVKQRS